MYYTERKPKNKKWGVRIEGEVFIWDLGKEAVYVRPLTGHCSLLLSIL